MSWSTTIADLWEDPVPFSDCTFYFLEGTEISIQAHKLILGTKSLFFKRTFFEDPVASSSEFLVNDVRASTFRQLLQFIYTGKIDTIPYQEYPALALAAEKFEVKDLLTKCKQDIFNRGAFSWYQSPNGNCQTKIDLWSFILRSGDEVLQSEDLLNINIKNLRKLLSSDNLNCHELTVCKAALRWAQNQCKKEDRIVTTGSLQFVLKGVFELVRFPLLTSKEYDSFIQGEGKLLLSMEESLELYRFYAVGTFQRFSCNRRKTGPDGLVTRLVPRTESLEHRLHRIVEDGTLSGEHTSGSISISSVQIPVKQESDVENPNVEEDVLPVIQFSKDIFETNTNETCQSTVSKIVRSKTDTDPAPASIAPNKENNSEELLPYESKAKRNADTVLKKRSGQIRATSAVKKHRKNSITKEETVKKSTKATSSKAKSLLFPLIISASAPGPQKNKQTMNQSVERRSSSSQPVSDSQKNKRPSRVRSKPSKELEEESVCVETTELEFLEDLGKITADGGLLRYSTLIEKCKNHPNIKSISIINVDVAEFHSRGTRFDKVNLSDLEDFSLEIVMPDLIRDEWKRIVKQIKLDDFFFFTPELNEILNKESRNRNIRLSVNGAIVTDVSHSDESSITFAFNSSVSSLIEDFEGVIKSLALGYCELSGTAYHSGSVFKHLTDLVICKSRFTLHYKHHEFLQRCSELESLSWFGIEKTLFNLGKELSCLKSLKRLAVHNVRFRLSVSDKVELTNLTSLIVYAGNWEQIENRLNTLFPKLDFAFFGGPFTRPTCSLLKKLLSLTNISTIELWFFDMDGTASTIVDKAMENDLKAEMTEVLVSAGIDPSTPLHFTLKKTLGGWVGKKNQETDFAKRIFELFKIDRFFKDLSSFNKFDDFLF